MCPLVYLSLGQLSSTFSLVLIYFEAVCRFKFFTFKVFTSKGHPRMNGVNLGWGKEENIFGNKWSENWSKRKSFVILFLHFSTSFYPLPAQLFALFGGSIFTRVNYFTWTTFTFFSFPNCQPFDFLRQ